MDWLPKAFQNYDATYLRTLLRKARKDRGLTQDEVAAALDIYKSVLSRLESGELEDPKFGIVAKLAYLYNLDLNEIAAAAGLPTRGEVRGPSEIEDPRLRLAVQRLMEDPDEAWKQQIITTLYMLVMTKPPAAGNE